MPEAIQREQDLIMLTTSEQQLGFLSRDVLPVLQSVCAGYKYDPGSSDLDDEQPINVRMTLGDYRRASRLKHELEKAVIQDPTVEDDEVEDDEPETMEEFLERVDGESINRDCGDR
jgi:hypothetical protein